MIRSARRTLLPVVLAAATLAVPAAAEAKPTPRGVCAKASASLRPSPLRACVRVRKAPKALPSAAGKREVAAVKGKRRRASESAAGWMMG